MDISQLSKLFQSHKEKFFKALEDSISSDVTTSLNGIKIDSDNFDITFKEAKDNTILYVLSLKDGFSLEDLDFSKSIESGFLVMTIKTKKDNMSGQLEISVPNSIAEFFVNAVNGDIKTNGVPISLAELHAINGDLNVYLTSGVYFITTETANGDTNNSVESDTKSNNRIICSTINGDINIKRF